MNRFKFTALALAISAGIAAPALAANSQPRKIILTTPPVPVAAVPEPASWAMMIFGFAVTGVAMRRRNSVHADA